MGDWNVSFSGENIFSFDNEPKSLPGFKSPGKVHGDGAKKKNLFTHMGGGPRRDRNREKISAAKGDAEGPGEVVYCMR